MRFVLLFSLCFSAFVPAFSQDIIVLRKDESEIMCKIVHANDSLVTYKLWNSADTSTYSLKRYDVLSFATSRQSQRRDKVVVDMTEGYGDGSLLGIYQTGLTVPGWVLPVKADTLYGYIHIVDPVMNQVKVHFTSETGFDTTYGTKSLKSYGYANVVYDRIRTCYRSELKNGVKAKDGVQFVHRAVDGPSRLYRFYTLKFPVAAYKNYDKNPPMYLGTMRRKFLMTNPAGRMIFSKGRTIPGMVNRIYFDYTGYMKPDHLKSPTMEILPDIVADFNYWYQNHGQKK